MKKQKKQGRRAVVQPRKQPRQQRSLQMVEAIKQAAAEIFAELGYARATTNKIAERAGVSVGSLYQYYPNKDSPLRCSSSTTPRSTRWSRSRWRALPILLRRSTRACEVPRDVGAGLHLCSDLVHFEFLDPDGRPVQAGEPGRVVVTDLTSTLMPLIRYEQGDLAIYEDRQHADGGTQRRILSIIGRDNDFIELADGTLRSAHDFTKICDGYRGVRQFRVVQQTIEYIRVIVAADPDFFEVIRRDLIDRLRRLLPPSVRAAIERVDRIPADAGGKARMLVSELGANA